MGTAAILVGSLVYFLLFRFYGFQVEDEALLEGRLAEEPDRGRGAERRRERQRRLDLRDRDPSG
jgi:hypothetical protein